MPQCTSSPVKMGFRSARHCRAAAHHFRHHPAPPLTLSPLSAGDFAGHSNGKLLIFICLLDFCAGLHILEVGNAIRPISMGFHAKTKPPRSCRSEGVLVLVLTALAHQAVKPLAEIVCYYFRCDSLEKRDKIIHMGFHLLSATGGSEKGRSASITQALTQYNKKRQRTIIPYPLPLFCFSSPAPPFLLTKTRLAIIIM